MDLFEGIPVSMLMSCLPFKNGGNHGGVYSFPLNISVLLGDDALQKQTNIISNNVS